MIKHRLRGFLWQKATSLWLSLRVVLMFQGSGSSFCLHPVAVRCLRKTAFYTLATFCHCYLWDTVQSSQSPLRKPDTSELDWNILTIWGDIKCYPIVALILVFLIASEANLFNSLIVFSSVAGGKRCLTGLMCVRIVTVMSSIFHLALPSVFSLMRNAFTSSHIGCFFLLMRGNSPTSLSINLSPTVYFAKVFSLMWIFL